MSADAHSQVRHVLSPVTTEIVIDGAVYSVDAIKQLIGRDLTRTHLINGQTYTTEVISHALDAYFGSKGTTAPADVRTADLAEEPEPESSRDRIYREIREKDTAAKEEILTAFVAKYGAGPDEVEIVHTGMHWHVRKRFGVDEERNNKRQVGDLVSFFCSSAGSQFASYGDHYDLDPAQTAIHFLSEYSNVRNAKFTREEAVARVTTDLLSIGMPQVVPIVTAYEALRQAVEGIKITFPGVPAELVDIPVSDDDDANDEDID